MGMRLEFVGENGVERAGWIPPYLDDTVRMCDEDAMLTPAFLPPGKPGPGYNPYQEIHHKPPPFPPSIRR